MIRQNIRACHCIGGEWVNRGSEIPIFNSSRSHDVVGTCLDGDATLAQAAISAAETAQALWANHPIVERERILDQIGPLRLRSKIDWDW